MSELVEIDAKLNRARFNLEDIKKFIPSRGAPVSPNDGITIKSRPDGLTHDFFAKAIALPIEFRLGIGDVIHDTRTSLDHLVYRILAKRGKLEEAQRSKKLRSVQFLIYDDYQRFKATAGKIKDLLGDDVITAMDALQKYKGDAEDRRRFYLWQLSELDNITRHRAIPVVDERLVGAQVTVSVGGQVIKRFPLHNPKGEALKDGAKLFSLAFDNAPPELHVDVNQTNAITFTGTGIVDGDGVWPVLRRLIDTAQSVVDDFAAKFLK